MNDQPAGAPEVSVLIPAFNEEQLIARAIECVRASFAALRHDSYEVIVCDNNSTDRTAEVARTAGATVVFEPHNQISRARNSAARAARGKWLIFVDADTFLPAELLRETLACLASGKICGGGSLMKFDRASLGPVGAIFLLFWTPVSWLFDLAAGSYVFCYRAAWEEVGGFDERVYAAEELYFSQKVKRWARARGLRFRVLTKTPIITSARKIEWYGQWRLLWRMILFARPGALKRRESCGLWYSRPSEADAKRP